MSRVKKDEVIKRQLKEEFDLKLELLKEEQKTENKVCKTILMILNSN